MATPLSANELNAIAKQSGYTGGQFSSVGLPPAITSKNTQATPVVNLTPPADKTNYAGILANAQTQALGIQQQIAQTGQPPEKNPNADYFNQPQQANPVLDYIKSIQSVSQPSSTQTYNNLYAQSGLEQQKTQLAEKARLTQEAQGRLGNISAQLQALNAEATAIPIQMQQDSVGRGRTAGGIAPLQADELRKVALRAIPLQAQAYLAQAEVANAQGQQQLAQDLYTQAEQTLNRQFELQMQDTERQYQFQTNLINQVYEFADKQEQRQLAALKDQAERTYKTQQDSINFEREKTLISLRQRTTPTSSTSGVPQTFEEQIADLKLSTGQKSDLVDIQTLEDQLSKLQDYASDGTLEGVGSLGLGTAKEAAFKVFGSGSKEGADVRTLIGNLKGQIAKLRGGTSFTANEEKLLNSYVPGINESTESILAKVRGLQDFLVSKKNAIIKVGGGTTSKVNDPLGIL